MTKKITENTVKDPKKIKTGLMMAGKCPITGE
jgi:hypothetical protein